MSRHPHTPAGNWAGVRGPAVIAACLLVLGGVPLLFAGRFLRHQRAAEQQAIMIHEADRARHEAGPRGPVPPAPPGQEFGR